MLTWINVDLEMRVDQIAHCVLGALDVEVTEACSSVLNETYDCEIKLSQKNLERSKKLLSTLKDTCIFLSAPKSSNDGSSPHIVCSQ